MHEVDKDTREQGLRHGGEVVWRVEQHAPFLVQHLLGEYHANDVGLPSLRDRVELSRGFVAGQQLDYEIKWLAGSLYAGWVLWFLLLHTVFDDGLA